MTTRMTVRQRLSAATVATALVGATFAAGSRRAASAAAPHVANPFVGATQYLSPDYTAEVNAQATADGGTLGTAEATVANYPTAVWMDRIAAIAGDSAPPRAAFPSRPRAGPAAGQHPGDHRDRHLRPAGARLRGAGLQRRDPGHHGRPHPVRGASTSTRSPRCWAAPPTRACGS